MSEWLLISGEVLCRRHLWTSFFQTNHPEGKMSDSDWQLLAAAAILACDGNDGVKDGVVTDPASCSFDPKTIQCQGERQTGRLSAVVRWVEDGIAPDRIIASKMDSGKVIRTRLPP